MSTFTEAERRCQMSFNMCGEVYHAYTSGREMPVFLSTTEDLAFAMNVIALAAFKVGNLVKILAFEVMNNHFHFVICGSQQDIVEFFRILVKKLKHTVPSAGKLNLTLKPIENLTTVRNNIVYTNRNGYVADPNHTPFSYPWGTGRYYFNDFLSSLSFDEISYADNRKMFRGANEKLPADWQITGGLGRYVAPPSFCRIDLGMAMFRDAHHYFAAVSKNIEAYSEIAVEIDDGEFLTDQELFARVQQIVRTKYQIAGIRELTGAQRLDLARSLHYDFRSSNGQIRRILGISQYEVDSLFPNLR